MRKEAGRKCKRAIIFENASGVKKGFNLRRRVNADAN